MSELTAQQVVRLEAMKLAMEIQVPNEARPDFLQRFQRYVFYGPDATKPDNAA